MSGVMDRTTAWVYSGVWGVVTRWLRVPDEPPSIPIESGQLLEQIRAAPGFLKLLKLQFWIVLALIDVALSAAWIAIAVVSPLAGAILFLPALVVIVLPDILAYIAIHLRYDTTWYVLTDRSVRIRRGIWIIVETTVTYENVQNVTVTQGPIDRLFGIADVVIKTAGGGGSGPHGGQAHGGAHVGMIEGVADAHRIRDLLLAKMGKSKSAGLGDDRDEGWTREQVEVLRGVRDAARRLAG